MTNPAHQWPKRMSAGAYAKRWYVDITPRTIANRVRDGLLPGGQDEGGQWYVWVHCDHTPAFDYTPPAEYDRRPQPLSQAANDLVARILDKAS